MRSRTQASTLCQNDYHTSQPTYPWDEKDNLFVEYKYDFFMPKGILSQFIVQTNLYITNHELVWKRGVVLEREGAIAEVSESYDARTIKIKISGRNQRDFMTIITEKVDELNAQYEKMKVEKLIPCNCEECKKNENPFFYKYQNLKRRIEKGQQEVECEHSFIRVNVRGLIDDVLNEEMHEIDGFDKGDDFMITTRNKVFVSYSHNEGDWLKKVQTHLKVLEHLGIEVDLWDDTKIKAGDKWRDEIENALAKTKVAILLVSTDFLASDFIAKDELPPLLKAAENEGATILPVIVKPSLFNRSKLTEFQAVNDPSKPLSSLSESEQEQVFVDLANRIIELVGEK